MSASEIDARLGRTWIPAEDIEQFANTLLGEGKVSIGHSPDIMLREAPRDIRVSVSVWPRPPSGAPIDGVRSN